MVASVTTIGSNIASATPSASGSADLVSAATNTNGITITSMSMWLYEVAATTTLSSLALKINGSAVMSITATGSSIPIAVGNFCAIKVPAGQAVGYTATEGSNMSSAIYITWKAG